MKTRFLYIAITTAAVAWSPFAKAVAPTSEEMAQTRQWAKSRFEGAKEEKRLEPFFSFNYDGKPSSELLKTWEMKRESRKLDDNRTEHTLAFTDPNTKLVVRCVGVEYGDYPCVEWTLFSKTQATKTLPILSDIQALDLRIERNAGSRRRKGRFSSASQLRQSKCRQRLPTLRNDSRPVGGEARGCRRRSLDGR